MEMILQFALVIVIGGVAGWLATRLLKADKHSPFMYVVLGVIGAVVGKAIIEFVGFEIVGQGVVVDFVVALVGALILVGVSKLVATKVAN